MDMIIKAVDLCGFFGPPILFSSSLYFLYKKSSLLYIYLLGFTINMLINFVVKGFLKYPRPSEDIHIFNALVNNGKRIGFDRYGMPSGHAQNVIYSTIFIYFALKDVKITIFYAIISLLTMYQRIKYKNHSVIQVIVGAIIGAVIGYSFYIYARKTMAGKLKGRDDDNAPI